jgi:hypothetical protein
MEKPAIDISTDSSVAQALENMLDIAASSMTEEEQQEVRQTVSSICMESVACYLAGVAAASDTILNNQINREHEDNLITWIAFTADDMRQMAILADSVTRK